MQNWWTIRTITDMNMQMHNPPHPGEVLREWLEGVTVTDAAERLGVTRAALSRVLNGAAGISPEMDLRLHKALGTTCRPITTCGRRKSGSTRRCGPSM